MTARRGAAQAFRCLGDVTMKLGTQLMNFHPVNDIETLSPRPMLFITDGNARSREFSEEACKLAGLS
jgi:hypothetical protein